MNFRGVSSMEEVVFVVVPGGAMFMTDSLGRDGSDSSFAYRRAQECAAALAGSQKIVTYVYRQDEGPACHMGLGPQGLLEVLRKGAPAFWDRVERVWHPLEMETDEDEIVEVAKRPMHVP